MGLYFSAEPWFANTGEGPCGGIKAEDCCGAVVMLRGRGLEMTVPKGAKPSAVRGAADTRRRGGEAVKVGAGIEPERGTWWKSQIGSLLIEIKIYEKQGKGKI